MDINLFRKSLASKQKLLNEAAKSVKIVFVTDCWDQNQNASKHKEDVITVTSKEDLAKQLKTREDVVFAPWKHPRGKFQRLDFKMPDDDDIAGVTPEKLTYYKLDPLRDKMADDYETIFNTALKQGNATLYAFQDYAANVWADVLYGEKRAQKKFPNHEPAVTTSAIGVQTTRKKAEALAQEARDAWVYRHNYRGSY